MRQLHNVEEQVNQGVPLAIILDEFSMIPPKMLGQVLHMQSLDCCQSTICNSDACLLLQSDSETDSAATQQHGQTSPSQSIYSCRRSVSGTAPLCVLNFPYLTSLIFRFHQFCLSQSLKLCSGSSFGRRMELRY